MDDVGELERVVAELKRETLLPCRVCRALDAGAVNATRFNGLGGMQSPAERDAREWGTLADTLLLIKPIWERSKATRSSPLRRIDG